MSRFGSIRWRLTAWVAAVMLLAAAVTFVAIYRGTGSSLRGQIDRELRSEARSFSARMPAGSSATLPRLLAAGRAFVSAQPFGGTSRLLYLQVPGQGGGVATNEPELFGLQPPDEHESASDQDAEARLALELPTAREGFSSQELPDVGGLRLLKRPVVRNGRTVAYLGVGEPLQTVDRAQDSVARTFLLAGGLALLGALLASWLVGDRVSRPIRRMARVAARVDAGDLAPRINARGGAHDEIRVLADAFDHMLDRLSDAFGRQRAFIADASHELRTPLTVIQGQLEVLAGAPDPDREEIGRVERLVAAEVARMSRLVDDLLLLTHSEERGFLREQEIELAPYLHELMDGVRATAERRFELGPVPDGRLDADPDRLAQALRNLLRNAVEHTAGDTGRVLLSARALGGERVQFIVEDDGQGIPAEQRDLVFDRFHRTDAARSRAHGGAGLGLAIVRAVAEAHGGRASAHASELGGARMEIELPGFRVQPREGRAQAVAARGPR
jgi:two-component system, OmpR family, sensor kinase